jgi:hypothetical protein
MSAWRGRAGAKRKASQCPEAGDSPDNTVGTLPKLLGDCVALIDNEVLVENLEDLAPRKIGHCEAVWKSGSGGKSECDSNRCGATARRNSCVQHLRNSCVDDRGKGKRAEEWKADG